MEWSELYETDDEILNAQASLQNLWTEDLLDLQQNKSLFTPDCIGSFEQMLSEPVKLGYLADATGKIGAGILDGNTILSAAFDECFSINSTSYCLANNVFFNHIYSIPWKVGLCVPQFCTNTDVAVAINLTGILWVNESSILCTNSKTPSYSAGATVMLVVSFVFVALVLLGTFVDAAVKECSNCCKSTSASSELADPNTEKTPLIESSKTRSPSLSKVRPLDFIKAFSLFQTVPTLLATFQGPSVITSLNGLRVISMFWVILGHVYAFVPVTSTVNNAPHLYSVLSRFSFQAVGNAYFSVDSFFFLSGVLVAYLTLKEMKKKDGYFPFLHYYIHRYLRLTPTYAFVLFFTMFLTRYLAVGPFMSLYDPFREPCSKYWWTNLLYINNFYPWKLEDECMGWAWYLANDMQFYIIAPLLLITAYHCLPASLIITAVFLASGFIIDAVLTGVFDFQASQLSILAYNYTSHPHASQTYPDAIYTKPWDRISPYIVGLVLGYILYRKLKVDLNRLANSLIYSVLWVAAAITAFWLVYGLYFTWHGHFPHTAENIIYITFGRFLWATSLAIIVFACHNGHGWLVNSFLSMKLWIPLARMTFNAYLVHPLVIFTVFGQMQTSLHYTDITMATFVIACVVFSYAAAAVVSVCVEFPLGTIEALLFRLVGAKRRESQRQNDELQQREVQA